MEKSVYELYDMVESVIEYASALANTSDDYYTLDKRTKEDYHFALSDINEEFLPKLKKLVVNIDGNLGKW
jgi:hypothetical protein